MFTPEVKIADIPENPIEDPTPEIPEFPTEDELAIKNIDLIFILDYSISMYNEGIYDEEVIRDLMDILKRITGPGSTDYVIEFIAFNTAAKNFLTISSNDDIDLNNIEEKIREQMTYGGGGTRYDVAFEQANKIVIERFSESQKAQIIVFMTDGAYSIYPVVNETYERTGERIIEKINELKNNGVDGFYSIKYKMGTIEERPIDVFKKSEEIFSPNSRIFETESSIGTELKKIFEQINKR